MSLLSPPPHQMLAQAWHTPMRPSAWLLPCPYSALQALHPPQGREEGAEEQVGATVKTSS